MDDVLGNKAEEIIQLLMQQNELLEKLLEKPGCGCGDGGGCCKDEDKGPCMDEDEGSCCGGGCH
ncbi:MAG: hypothetical protein KDJ15_00925 [Alphaproteobacteria bacterium]|nr:hypothetical protein [Alphaproteobacteria bacterium]